ncbi:MAG: hypothetical protein ACI9YE_001167 [Psychroserpens sp.]|jgi:hypothetical protein
MNYLIKATILHKMKLNIEARMGNAIYKSPRAL